MAGIADGLARRRLMVSAIAALMLLGWAPAGARAVWLSPVDLSAAGGDASQPQVAVDAAGDAASYARPRGATPTVVSLVPAFALCTPAGANRTHGAAHGYPSCAPPVQASSFLTVRRPA